MKVLFDNQITPTSSTELANTEVAVIRLNQKVSMLFGFFPKSIPKRKVLLKVNGEEPKGPYFTLTADGTAEKIAVLTLGEFSSDAGNTVTWSAAGETDVDFPLFTGTLGRDLRVVSERAENVINMAAAGPSRSLFARQLTEILCSYLKLNTDAAVLSICKKFLENLTPVGVIEVSKLTALSENLSLITADQFNFDAEIESVQVISDERYRVSSAKPHVSKGRDNFLLILDADVGTLARSQVILWTRLGPVRMQLENSEVTPASSIPEILQGQDDQAYDGLKYLCEGTSAYLSPDSQVKSLLVELSELLPKPASSNLSLGSELDVGVSAAIRNNDGVMAVFGWCLDNHNLVEDIYWLGPNGYRASVLKNASSILHRGLNDELKARQNPATETVGFAASVVTPKPMIAYGPESFLVSLKSGRSYKIWAPQTAKTARNARDLVLSMPTDPGIEKDVLEKSLSPSIRSLQKEYVSVERVRFEETTGAMPADPRCSIIIPVYKNLDYLKPLYAALAMDDDHANDELIIVVDDPDSIDKVKGLLSSCYALYGMPFHLICHIDNFGYAPATNTGCSRAKSPYLLLLNSDVMPKTRGWLGSLIKSMQRRKNCVAAAPKLLFADGSIQHAGLEFGRGPEGQVFNRSLYKGYPANFPAANKSKNVTAVTGACLLVEAHAYQSVGGISEDYVVGDFEDTDFCLKLRGAGYHLWYDSKIELYHFERQSIDLHEFHSASLAERYNQALHQNRWFDKTGSSSQ